MKGKIEMHSKPNRGTAIVIMIKSKPGNQSLVPKPVFDSKYINKEGMEIIREQQQPNQSIISCIKEIKRSLIVEDIPYNQEKNRKFLEKCKVQYITIANNGQEAVNIFLKVGPQYFDLILMDIDMPVMDGKAAIKIIRQEEKRRNWSSVKIVILTAFSESKTQKELLDQEGQYGANGFYSKPASLQTVLRIIRDFSISAEQNAKKVPNNILLTRQNSAYKNSGFSMTQQYDSQLILVADDDSFNLTMITKMLKLCGYQALEARNGREAVGLYDQNWKRIKLILMDCEMPILDGLEATRQILAKQRDLAAISGRKVMIYGLTGHVGSEYKQKCSEAGMKEVLEKPIKIEKLRSLLASN